LTAAPRIKPTLTRCRSARQHNPRPTIHLTTRKFCSKDRGHFIHPASAIADENGLVDGAVVGGPVGLVVGGLGSAAVGNAVTNHGSRYHHYLRTHNRQYNQ
jgi:hypothetical protein